MIVQLPWPPIALWPNVRQHWAAHATAKRTYKQAAWALAQGNRMDADRLHVSLTFCPPDKRRRDLDNMIAAMKAGLDGISAAIRVDDSKWQLSAEVGPVVPGGSVIVTVRPAA